MKFDRQCRAALCTCRHGNGALDSADEPRTLEEIGQSYGVTRELVRQIGSKTMCRLRHPSGAQALRDYLD